MPANSRVTQGPQNKDKADTTLGTSSRTVRPRGPGSQEYSGQENEVSARAEVGTGWTGGWLSGARCQVALEGLTLSLGRLTCVSCGWRRGPSSVLGALRREPGWGLAWDSRDLQLETGGCGSVQMPPVPLELRFLLRQRRVLPAGQCDFPPVAHKVEFLFSSFKKNTGFSLPTLCELNMCLCVYLL